MQFPCFRVLPDSAKALVRGDMLKHSIFWLRTFSVKFLSKIMLLLFMWLGAIICPPYPFTYPLPPFTVFFSIFYFFLFPFLLTSSIFLLFYLFPFYQNTLVHLQVGCRRFCGICIFYLRMHACFCRIWLTFVVQCDIFSPCCSRWCSNLDEPLDPFPFLGSYWTKR